MAATKYRELGIPISFLVILLAFVNGTAEAAAAPKWELRVCAEPYNFPMSSREEPGFENRIIEIIAEYLGAEVTYVWIPYTDEAIQRYLHAGHCDVMTRVSDGGMGLLSTTVYYTAPYVFVYRADRGLDIRSLDDEQLRTVRVGTYPSSGPEWALANRGIIENVKSFPPVPGPGGLRPSPAIVAALLNDEIDVAIVYGPDVGHIVAQHPEEFVVRPVQPEIDFPLLPMFHSWTMGVRPGDEALRDQLIAAMSARWDDIQAVFREYHVPLLPLPSPRLSALTSVTDGATLKIGVVIPMRTRYPAVTDDAATAAARGALMAYDIIGRQARELGINVKLLLANSPTAEAAERAARRLVATEGVAFLIGGIGEGQAETLSAVAGELGVPFINIGSLRHSLRSAATAPYTFHVEASVVTYVRALLSFFEQLGKSRWYVVYVDDPANPFSYEDVLHTVASWPGTSLAGSRGVSARSLYFGDVFAEIRAAMPDVVLLLLDEEQQEYFLAQYESEKIPVPVTGVFGPVGQTRAFATRLRMAAPTASETPRVVLWEANLSDGDAGTLNEEFASRYGVPMDASAWAAYTAVRIAFDAVAAVGPDALTNRELLIEHLRNPSTTFDVGKRVPVFFDAGSHELRQPLYVVQVDAAAPWGSRLSNQLGLVRLVGEVVSGPGEPTR